MKMRNDENDDYDDDEYDETTSGTRPHCCRESQKKKNQNSRLKIFEKV
jgi:hypothetical protein